MTNLGEKEIRLHVSRQQGGVIIKTLLVIPLVLVLVVALAFAFYEGRKAYYDVQVREMCAKDGGVKVYETVTLPPEKFNKYGMVSFYRPTQGENALGSEYIYKFKITHYRHKNPGLFRMHTKVYYSDMRLLGESVFYKRGGGDMPGPWHGSSFMCPELAVANDILRQIFIKE